jgi:hypothetical protein
MRRISLTVLGLTLLAFAVLAGQSLLTKSGEAAPAAKGIVQRIVTTPALGLGDGVHEIDATCAEDETLTGGGYQVGSIGSLDKVYVNAPLDSRTWVVEVINNSGFPLDVWAFAVCVKLTNKP